MKYILLEPFFIIARSNIYRLWSIN